MVPKNQSKKLDITKLSDDDLQDRFTEVFEKRVGDYNDLTSFECLCKRENGSVVIEVTVIGMAGSPTMDDYKNGKVKNSDAIVLDYEGRGSIKFKLLPTKTISMNTNNYVVTYQAV